MQTFMPYSDPKDTAKVLDRQRLGKQRVEAIQIARTLLKISDGWKNHPAVKMWQGYEPYLIREYILPIMFEWQERGYKNGKCMEHAKNLINIVSMKKVIKPPWINNNFCLSHRSNLIRKKPDYYGKFWPNVPDNLPYIWPI